MKVVWSYKMLIFFTVCLRNSRWLPLQDYFNIGSYGKSILELFLFEASKPFDSKFGWNIPLWSFTRSICILCQSEIQHGSHHRTKFSERTLWEHDLFFYQKLETWLNPNCLWIVMWSCGWFLSSFSFFVCMEKLVDTGYC